MSIFDYLMCKFQLNYGIGEYIIKNDREWKSLEDFYYYGN